MGDYYETRPYTYLFSLDVAVAAQNACYTPPERRDVPATGAQELWLAVACASGWLLALAGLLVVT